MGVSDIIYSFTRYPTEEQKVMLVEIEKNKKIIHQNQLIHRVKGRSWGIRVAADYWAHQGKKFRRSPKSRGSRMQIIFILNKDRFF